MQGRPSKRLSYDPAGDYPMKIPRLHPVIEPIMPPPQGDKTICSCPPFECLCHRLTGPNDAFLPSPTLLAAPSGFPGSGLLSPTGLYSGHPLDSDPFQQASYRNPYSDIIDFERFQSQGIMHEPIVKPEPNTGLSLAPSGGLNTRSGPIPDCMYPSDTMRGLGGPPHLAGLGSPTQLHPDPSLPLYPMSSTRSDLHTPPGSQPAGVVPTSPYQLQGTGAHTSPPHYSTSTMASSSINAVGPSYPPQGLSPHTLDQFDFTDPAEFLEMGQPINKELPAPSCAIISKRPSISSCDVTKGASSDLSSLLGNLPPIASLLGEEEGENTHIDKILGLSLPHYSETGSPDSCNKSNTDSLSPASSSDQKVPSEGAPAPLSPCRGPSPPSLIELQPIKSAQGGNTGLMMANSPKKFSDIFQTGKQLNKQTAFQPYGGDHTVPRQDAPSYQYSSCSQSSPRLQASDNPEYIWQGDMLNSNFQTTSTSNSPENMSNFHSNHSINITLTYN